MRTLTTKTFTEEHRLRFLMDELLKLPPPQNDDELSENVTDILAVLKEKYGKPLSAVTKFLWCRFPNQVVIYDSLAWNFMRRNSPNLRDKDTYLDFVREWRVLFNLNKEAAREAAMELLTIQKFTLATEMNLEQLEAIISKGWFFQRIFDHAICNDQWLFEEKKRKASLQ